MAGIFSLIDKFFTLLLTKKGQDKVLNHLIDSDPQVRALRKDLEKRKEDLKQHGDQRVKDIKAKYKGTPYEKYFKD